MKWDQDKGGLSLEAGRYLGGKCSILRKIWCWYGLGWYQHRWWAVVKVWIYILEMEPAGFLERLDVQWERNRGVKDDVTVLAWATGRMEFLSIEMWMITDRINLVHCGEVRKDGVSINRNVDDYRWNQFGALWEEALNWRWLLYIQMKILNENRIIGRVSQWR